jgi:large subunit ribosomal protein L29
MKFKDVVKLNDEEVQTELDRLRRHVFDLRAQSVTEKLESPAMLQHARRDIARLLTENRKREQAQTGNVAL